jgi:YVTN family beta-propeller protein
MVPSLVLRSRPVLYRLFLLLSVLITATTLRAQITVPTTGGGLSLAVNPITNKIYIPSRGSLGAVTVIDGAINTTKILTAGTNPSKAVVDPVINKIYVTDQPANDVIVIDGASDTVTATLPTGNGPLPSLGNTELVLEIYLQWSDQSLSPSLCDMLKSHL